MTWIDSLKAHNSLLKLVSDPERFSICLGIMEFVTSTGLIGFHYGKIVLASQSSVPKPANCEDKAGQSFGMLARRPEVHKYRLILLNFAIKRQVMIYLEAQSIFSLFPP